MPAYSITPDQAAVIECPPDVKIFLEGPAGCGKTTAGVERLLRLLKQGIPGSAILLLVPQRTLAKPYLSALSQPGGVAGGLVSALTIGGLAKRMVDLFWPLVAEQAGFAQPQRTPTFLTLETAQYYMAHLVRPLFSEGYFDSIHISRNRLYSQVLDNLNKSAVVGFPYGEIGQRLKSAWGGSAGQGRVYEDAQECASRFRQFCLTHNLLDFSLQIEVFINHLWPIPLCREYLLNTYQHLIVDNLEEDVPITHDLLRQWLPLLDSALLIFDQEGGYRQFLGADPQTAYTLKDLCREQVAFEDMFVTSTAVAWLGRHLASSLKPAIDLRIPAGDGTQCEPARARVALAYQGYRYYPQMLDWVAEQIADLVKIQGVKPGEIVVLAPYLSDALLFSLVERLDRRGIPARSHRPSRSLRDEPVAGCLITLAYLAHPQWTDGHAPGKFDLAYALVQAIDGMDLVRARLLSEIVHRKRGGVVTLSSFEQIKADIQERITYRLGERYERLRVWIEAYLQNPAQELDHFFSQLFGEVLSQPGFGFHVNLAAGEVTANLIESAQKFRWVAGADLAAEGKLAGKEYLEMLGDGVIAAQYIRSWRAETEDSVLLAPAYTFLMHNRPVDVQFWLDAGSRGWSERLYQPLTHPYVLNRHWQENKKWTDIEELEAQQAALYRLVLGLVRRCRRSIYLGFTEFGEQGYEQRGPLLRAFKSILQMMPGEGNLG